MPAISPSRLLGGCFAGAGRTSATGFPYRVMVTGFRVLRTRSTTERQLILNLEAAISSIIELYHH